MLVAATVLKYEQIYTCLENSSLYAASTTTCRAKCSCRRMRPRGCTGDVLPCNWDQATPNTINKPFDFSLLNYSHLHHSLSRASSICVLNLPYTHSRQHKWHLCQSFPHTVKWSLQLTKTTTNEWEPKARMPSLVLTTWINQETVFMSVYTNIVIQYTRKAELKASIIIYILHLNSLQALNIYTAICSTISPHQLISAF